MSDRREEIQSRMNMGGGYLSGTCMNEQHMIHVGADVRYLQEQLAEAEARADEAERLRLELAWRKVFRNFWRAK